MILYFTIGIVLMFLIEFSNHVNKEKLEYLGEKATKFNMFERVIGILIWPVIVFLAIRNYLK